MRMNTLWLRLSCGACLIWLLAACGAAGSVGNTAAIEGNLWRLVEYGPADAPIAALPDVSVTVKFDAGNTVGGSGGCNSYGGNYQLNGQSLRISQVVSTMMACENTAVMDQESRYLAALGSATALHVAGTDLMIDYDGGKLHFTRI
jgi:heat shock protein HslJ